jgi:Trk K+ transport system NAD-binding subunit
MKFLVAEVVTAVRSRRGRRNLRVLTRFFLILAAMILAYSIVFHVLMQREGQDHTWITGVYWTLTVMSTLGFGDITFHTDLGRVFSIVVLLSGTLFMLVLLPFTFIEFFYTPWMQAQAAARAPRQLPATTRGHVLLTNVDPVTAALIRRLEPFRDTYALLVPELEDALRLHDQGLNVVVGELDDPEAWKRVRVEQAALVATTSSDARNTSVASTVRGIADGVRIVGTATREASVDVLELAGCNEVLRLEEMLGQSFARRTIGGDALAHVIGRFDEILIAEAMTRRTPLVGKTLRECEVTQHVGVTAVGVWERGWFEPALPDVLIHDNTVLLLAGSQEAVDRYNEQFRSYYVSAAPVVILGGGRVGRATGRALAKRGLDYRIVEILPERLRNHDPDKCVLGDAADLDVLKRAGILEAPTVIVTTHDDDLNVYLTVYCRRLRADIQIISRATRERIVGTLHRAGADIVMSYASIGASSLMNLLRRGRILMVTEGLDVFRVNVPAALVDKRIADSSIRERTGCNVVAISTAGGQRIVPGPEQLLPADAQLVLIGSIEAEEQFFEVFGRDDVQG